MFRACGRCGKIHDTRFECKPKRIYVETEERKQRSSGAWRRKSEEIRERANHLCEVCRDRGAYTYRDLEVHHIVKLKDNSDGLLDNLNLICLCAPHHKEADAGKIDADYLRELARKREEA